MTPTPLKLTWRCADCNAVIPEGGRHRAQDCPGSQATPTRKNWHYRLRYKLCEPLWSLAAAFEDWPRDFQQRGPRQAACDRGCEAAAVWVDRKLGIREWNPS